MAAAACCLVLAPIHAQDAKPACKPGSKTAECTTKPDSSAPPKSLSEEFPFPTEQSKHGGNAEGLPEMPTGPVPDPPASSNAPLPSSSNSGSGDNLPPGTSSSRTDDDADTAPTAASPNAPVKAAPLKDLGSRADLSKARAKLEATRVEDDLKVAKFYLGDRNYQGAYLRYKDAVDHDPGNPDARFGLAETAAQLNKREEAVLNYQECLKADPGGDHDKAARKALAKLGVVPKP